MVHAKTCPASAQFKNNGSVPFKRQQQQEQRNIVTTLIMTPLKELTTNVSRKVSENHKVKESLVSNETSPPDLSRLLLEKISDVLNSQDENRAEETLKEIEALVDCCEEAEEPFYKHGGYEAVVGAMEQHPKCQNIQMFGMDVLSNVLEFIHPLRQIGHARKTLLHARKTLLLEGRAIEVVLAAMKQFRSNLHLAGKGLRFLCFLSDNFKTGANALVNEFGAAPLLVKAVMDLAKHVQGTCGTSSLFHLPEESSLLLNLSEGTALLFHLSKSKELKKELKNAKAKAAIAKAKAAIAEAKAAIAKAAIAKAEAAIAFVKETAPDAPDLPGCNVMANSTSETMKKPTSNTD